MLASDTVLMIVFTVLYIYKAGGIWGNYAYNYGETNPTQGYAVAGIKFAVGCTLMVIMLDFNINNTLYILDILPRSIELTILVIYHLILVVGIYIYYKYKLVKWEKNIIIRLLNSQFQVLIMYIIVTILRTGITQIVLKIL